MVLVLSRINKLFGRPRIIIVSSTLYLILNVHGIAEIKKAAMTNNGISMQALLSFMCCLFTYSVL